MRHSARQLYNDFLTLSRHFSGSCCSNDKCDDFTFIDFFALRSVHENPDCSVQTVGNRLGFSKSGATRVVKRLESRGLLTLCTSAEDARIKCLALTALGEQCLMSVEDVQAARIEMMLKKIGPEKSQQLMEGMQALMTQIVSSDN